MARTTRRRSGPPHDLELPPLTPLDAAAIEPHGDYEAAALVDLDLVGVDATGAAFAACRIERGRLDDSTFGNARLTDCLLVDVGATGFDAGDSTWRDVILDRCRIGALAAVRADWSSVRVRGGKLDFLILAGGRLDDVAFEGCEIGELDLGDARLRNVIFTGCRIGVLDVEGAFLEGVDLTGAGLRTIRGIAGLRGATVSPAQLVEMGPLLAHHLGIRVGDAS
jgi:uncharacterized protein YjbI with pentapeptide repeats